MQTDVYYELKQLVRRARRHAFDDIAQVKRLRTEAKPRSIVDSVTAEQNKSDMGNWS